MPSCLLRLLVVVACLLCSGWGHAWAADSPAGALVLRHEAVGDLREGIMRWMEPGSTATVEEAVARADRLEPVSSLEHEAFNGQNTLWLRLRVQRAPDAPSGWSLALALPYLDDITLYQRSAQGQWQAMRSGDALAQSAWKQRGLYPDFDLKLDSAGPQDLWLRVRNFKAVSLPLALVPTQERESQRLYEWLALGVLLGGMLAVCLVSCVRYLEHRQSHDAWAAAFGALVALTTAQVNGVLGATLWAQSPAWGNLAYGVIPVWAVGASLLFVRMLYTLSTQYHRYDQFLGAVGLVTLGTSVTYFIDRPHAESLGDVVLFIATASGLVATFLSRQGSSPLWRFMLAAYAPQSLCLMWLLLDSMSLVPNSVWVRYWFSASVAFSLPMLTYALSLATHDRKELHLRARHLPTQDALTGLLTRESFQTEVDKAYEKAVNAREPIALVLVRIVNYEHIRAHLGNTVAEQSLLRAVVKLHRVLRDTDPAGRVEADQFGLLIDGVLTQRQLTERIVQLIASGLVPLPGLHPPLTLQFQAACVLLHENPISPDRAVGELQELLRGMSTHTRRPVRFLEAAQTQPVTLDGHSALS